MTSFARPCPAKSCRTANFTITRAKYLEEGTRLVIPAKLTKAQVAKFQDYAVRAFRAIDGDGHGALRFLPGEAHRQDFCERAEYDSRFHLHQHVSEAVGSLRACPIRS